MELSGLVTLLLSMVPNETEQFGRVIWVSRCRRHLSVWGTWTV
jgi:hypothetical protein